ncbi:MAG: hypothetical protein ABI633_02295 [Burkholderiales bacterium]
MHSPYDIMAVERPRLYDTFRWGVVMTYALVGTRFLAGGMESVVPTQGPQCDVQCLL